MLSLFSGAGGLDLGFRRAGFDVPLSVDTATAAVATLNANAGSGATLLADIRKLSASQLVAKLRSSGSVLPRGIIGGPPCQGFSRGNASKDPKDPRNRLPFVYAALLGGLDELIGIDFFVFENVVGLVDNKRFFARIERAFQSHGFRLFSKQLDAENFGVPQTRRRLFLVGLNTERFPDEMFTFPHGRARPKTVRDVLTGLPSATFFARSMDPSDVPFHPNHWTMVPRSARFHERRFNRWRSFRRLAWDRPSPTVAYGNREIHVHPNGKRRLTVLEAMLLQGFPKDYVLKGNFSEQVTQVSNAVPPPVAYALARSLKKVLDARLVQ
ncbi:MAG: DNA cytosine methyltransferase [Planctomycetes bacterium]|nr:DNA cytosine methyltransferase [Planctomycetota bacterium]